MKKKKGMIALASVGLAALSAIATSRYLSAADERALGGAQLVDVLLAKRDIAKGLPGEQALDGGFIEVGQLPRRFRPPTAVLDVKSLRGKVALGPLAVGVPIVGGDFVDPRDTVVSFAQRIPKGMQAVTISADEVRGVARLVVPGDRVNLLVTMRENPDDEATARTRFVLQGIEVLAVGQTTGLEPGEAAPAKRPEEDGAAKAQGHLITLAVPAQDAARVVFSHVSGGLHLTLVPPDFRPAPVAPVDRANLSS